VGVRRRRFAYAGMYDVDGRISDTEGSAEKPNGGDKD